jgi:hypothetical protein
MCTTTLAQEQQARAQATAHNEEQDPVPVASVFVPHATMLAIFQRLRISSREDRRVHTAMLLASIDEVQFQVNQCTNARKRATLEQQYDQIQDVRKWRRQRQAAGCDWQRVVAPSCMSAGWQVEVGMPVAA